MTMMGICVLQKNNRLACGTTTAINSAKFVAALKEEMETVEDVLEGVNKARYPWNFTYYLGGKRKLRKRKLEDFYFREQAGLPVKFLTFEDILYEAPEGALFIDLINKKAIHLDYESPESDDFPIRLEAHKDYGDPYVRKKVKECEEEAESRGVSKYSVDCTRFYRVKKKTPIGFTMLPIKLDKIGDDDYLTEDIDAINTLIDKLKKCNHSSGEFYRSLGACL